jgi:hypothetical protein
MLTSSQQLTLKNAIIADGTLNSFPNNSDGADAIAQELNKASNPAFIVWKTNVQIEDVGNNIVGTEIAGLSSLNNTRLQTIVQLSSRGVNPSFSDRRAFFDDIFSGAGGVNTRARLLALWKRTATKVEKLFATGTGSDASPATLSFEGNLNYQDVEEARNS